MPSGPGGSGSPLLPLGTLDAQWRELSPRALSLWRVTAVVATGVLAVVVAVPAVAALGWAGLGVAAVVAGGGAALAWRAAGRRHRSWGYAERESDLLVSRGVLVHRLSVVPYGRMQFVDVTSGPLERRYGLATVVLHTAAAATDARIPGLDAEEAARLRDRLARLGEAEAAGL